MSWTVTRDNDVLRIDVTTNPDAQGRPKNHRVFTYNASSFVDGNGAPLTGDALATAARQAARAQVAAEQAPASPIVDVLASGGGAL